jgi:HEXXH motif-containing protein
VKSIVLCHRGETVQNLGGAHAAVLNITRQRSAPQLAEALAHEAGHAYLLGSTLGEPLVENDPTERFASPLRADSRPMDGLVHGSFVLARMMWCDDRLLASGALNPAERDTVAEARARHHRGFLASQAIIETEAHFTPTGEALWSAARAWFRDA